MASYTADFSQQCETTLAVHVQLRKLLICEYLVINHLRERFRLNCRTDLPPSMIQEQSIEKILDFLERDGKFSEGNYNFIKEKTADVHVEISMLIQQAEARIKEIRANSLMVKTFVTEVDQIDVEKETREEVDLILLAASEKLLCRSEDDDEDASGLLERYQDLNTLSDNFLTIWHKEFCKCRKQYGRRLLLQYVRQGARFLELGENKFDRFRRNIAPKLLKTLKKSSSTTLHVFNNCGASLVSVVPSSVLSFWIFDSVINLDKLWRKYEEEGLHVNLQEIFNTNDVLSLLNVDKISLNITIEKSNYLTYRQILAEKDPETAHLTASVQTLGISVADKSMETSDMDLKQRLYEINKRRSETPTVLSYLLQSDDIPKMEPLYASVSLLEFDCIIDFLEEPGHVAFSLNPKDIRKIKNIPDDLFCTSDEYSWERNIYFDDSIVSNRNSTCVFILGEAGYGKTTYCHHLLRQWCQGKELQKFDYVFYVDSSVLQTPRTSMSDLISSSLFGDDMQDHVDHALRKKKCLVLIDGVEYFRDIVNGKYELQTLVRDYRYCVVVTLMRPLDFVYAISSHSFAPVEVTTRVIQFLGLDEQDRTSLYYDIIVQRYEIKQSEQRHKIRKVDFQQNTKDSILQTDPKDSYAFPVAKESDSDFANRESHTQADKALDPNDSKPFFKEPNTGEIPKEESLKQSIKEHDPEYGKRRSYFYKIKGLLEEKLCENYNSILKVPILGSACVRLVAEGKDLPKNITSLYLCLIDELVGRYESFSSDEFSRGVGDQIMGRYGLFQSYQNIYRHVHTLCKLGKVAYNSMFSFTPELLTSKELERYLETIEIVFSFQTRILVPLHTLNEDSLTEQHVRFSHKCFQDTLVAMYIVTVRKHVLDSFCRRLTSVDSIIYMSNTIMLVCGLNSHFGCQIIRNIQNVIDKDRTVCHYREYPSDDFFIREFYALQLSWYTEYRNTLSTMGSDRKDSFYVSDIRVDFETDIETINKTVNVLSDQDVIVKSLYIDVVPNKSDLTNNVLIDFLASNTSLETISIVGRRTYISIEPLSFPYLRVLQLQNLFIRKASNDDKRTKSLLSYLPMLQRLHLNNIRLNNRLLGLTSSKGEMPLLKQVYIGRVDMDHQSIELASDMVVIEMIILHSVKMSPKGWANFIRSLTNIYHSFDIYFYSVNMDAKSKEMVRKNETFAVKRGNNNSFYFRRVYQMN